MYCVLISLIRYLHIVIIIMGMDIYKEEESYILARSILVCTVSKVVFYRSRNDAGMRPSPVRPSPKVHTPYTAEYLAFIMKGSIMYFMRTEQTGSRGGTWARPAGSKL